MKCHKCNHIGFDHLSQCNKCGTDLTQNRQLLGFSGLAVNVPFLLGSLLKWADEERKESSGVLLQKEVEGDSGGIDMLEGFELLDEKEPEMHEFEDSEEELLLLPAMESDKKEDSDKITRGHQEEDLGLSLAFEDGVELVLEPELASSQESSPHKKEPLQKGRDDSQDSYDLGDMEELTLEDFVEDFSLEKLGPADASGKGTSKIVGKVPSDSTDMQGTLREDRNIELVGLEEGLSLDDPSLEGDILEFELEEIDFDALTLELEERPAESAQETEIDSPQKKHSNGSPKT